MENGPLVYPGYVYLCVCVCMRACVHVHLCVCMCVCECMCICMHASVYVLDVIVRLIFFRIFRGHIVQHSLSFAYILVYIEHLGSQKTY